MSSPACGRCGRPVPPGAELGGICPACLTEFIGTDSLTRRDSTNKRTVDLPNDGRPPETSPRRPSLDEIPEEAAAAAADPARQFFHYVLVRQVGKGGMGTVWKAWDRKLTRMVAVKFLHSGGAEDVQRFFREAKLAARLRHPNIATVFEVGEAPSQAAGQAPRPYLVMEFIDGDSLAKADLPLEETVDLLIRVAEGVEAAHRAGVIHRDLKPQNVMLTREKWPYVTDFGLAKSLDAESSLSMTGMVMGTPAFMPPEQAQGRTSEIDARTDVYSLGATAYAVLCKANPFQGLTPQDILYKVLNSPVRPPREFRPDFPEPLERILLQAMAKLPAQRYPSAAAFADDLRRFLESGKVAAVKPVSRSARSPLPKLLGAASVALVAVLAAVLWRPSPQPPVAPAPEKTRLPEPPAWIARWREARGPLTYAGFDPARAPAAAALLREMPAHAAPEALPLLKGDLREARRDLERWLSAPKADWLGLAADAARLRAWAELLGPSCPSLSADLEALRAAAVPVAEFRGTFTLRMHLRQARLEALRSGGKRLPLPAEPESPLVLELDVAEYELELGLPGGKRERLALPAPTAGAQLTVLADPLRAIAR